MSDDTVKDLARADELCAEVGDTVQLQGEKDKIILETQKITIERQREEIEDIKQDRKQRKIFSYYIFGFMCAYMAASLVVVFMCGLGCMALDVSVLITLLTTALANVIGIFTFVAKYLFHK